jgi:hypothetical protein
VRREKRGRTQEKGNVDRKRRKKGEGGRREKGEERQETKKGKCRSRSYKVLWLRSVRLNFPAWETS